MTLRENSEIIHLSNSSQTVSRKGNTAELRNRYNLYVLY